MKLSFDGLEAVLQSDLIPTEDGKHITITLYGKKESIEDKEAAYYEVCIDGVKWFTSDNPTHGVILYTLLRDHVTEYMHYVTTGTNFYYYFDCLDGELGERYLTSSEVNKLVYNVNEDLPESNIIRIAKEYEATLYRYEKTEEGDYTNETLLYDCLY